jgi:transcriptional regulator with XRE-family HTH domain
LSASGKYKKTYFSSQLHELMEKKGIVQTDIASACGVKQPTVSGWLNGSIPRGNRLVDLARVLGVSPGTLLEESNCIMEPPGREYSVQNFKEMYYEQKLRAEQAEKELAKLKAALAKLGQQKGTS